jgi:ABC-type lipoprotein release transport system permease subunit
LLVFPPFVPQQRSEIRDIQVLPAVLGGFLSLLAIGAVGHALMTAVRRRQRDIALLRVLGMTPAQSCWVTRTQAAVTGSAALLAGVPLGLAAGRALWRAAAHLIPLDYQPPTAPWALLLIGPAALACSLLLAQLPGSRAARLLAGPLLRQE